MGVLSTVGACLLVLALAGCGDDGMAGSDSGASDSGPDDGSVGPAAPTSPEPPAPPSFGTCAPGWRDVVLDGVSTCDPWPEGGREACIGASVHRAGEPGCANVGRTCPSSEFSDGLPTDRPVVYVRAGAMGGSGTLASPFGTLIAALPAPGAALALGPGSHDAGIQLRNDEHVYGACTERTVITSPSPSGTLLLTTDNEIHDVRVENTDAFAVVARGATADVRLSGVIVHAPRSALVAARGAPLAALDVASLGRHGPVGRALSVEDSAARLERFVAEGTADSAVVALGAATTVMGTDLTFVDIAPTATIGRAISAEALANVDASRIAALRVGERSFMARGGTLVVGDVAANETTNPAAAGPHLVALLGGTLRAERVLAEAAHGAGANADDDGSTLDVSDALVRDTQPDSLGRFGFGLSIRTGTTLGVRRAVLARNHTIGLDAFGGDADVEDLVVLDTQPQPADGRFGRAVGIEEEGSISIRRARAEGGAEGFIAISPTGGIAVSLTDMLLSATSPAPNDAKGGRGLSLEGTTTELARVRVEDVHDMGVFVRASTFTSSDLTVAGVRARTVGRATGRCLEIQRGASVQAVRTRVENCDRLGVFAFEPETNADFHGLTVQALGQMAATGDTNFGVAVSGATTDIGDFRVSEAGTCGVWIGSEGTLRLTNGVVDGNAIGACVQDADYDFDRLTDGVEYRDNGVNLQSTDLPVPEAGSSLGG